MSVAFGDSKKQHSSLGEQSEKKLCPQGGRSPERARCLRALRPTSWLLGTSFSWAGSVALGQYLSSLSPSFLAGRGSLGL